MEPDSLKAMPNFSFRQDNCSFYSGTKALAEEILQAETWLYGYSGSGLGEVDQLGT